MPKTTTRKIKPKKTKKVKTSTELTPAEKKKLAVTKKEIDDFNNMGTFLDLAKDDDDNTEITEFVKANASMDISELIKLAKVKGVQYSGLTKNRLIKKINYY